MAAGLGFKDFVTGEVLTAADVDGYLMQGVWVFASAAARSAAVTSPQEGNYSFLKDTNSTEYYDGAAWVAVGGGGGGKVLQVISTVKSDSFTTSTNAGVYTDVTGLSVTITPTSATSKILVLASIASQSQIGGNFSVIQLVRNSTPIFIGDAAGSRVQATTQLAQVSQDNMLGAPITFLDSPATTSSTTYKIQGCSLAASPGFFYVNRTATDTNSNSYSRAASSITVMEIGA